MNLETLDGLLMLLQPEHYNLNELFFALFSTIITTLVVL